MGGHVVDSGGRSEIGKGSDEFDPAVIAPGAQISRIEIELVARYFDVRSFGASRRRPRSEAPVSVAAAATRRSETVGPSQDRNGFP